MGGQGAQGAMEPFVIRRTFDAAPEAMWRAWTEPERFTRWFGPKGCKLDVLRMEVRPGGVCHYRMVAPEGEASWGRFEYREIVPPERLVFLLSFADEAGNVIRAPFSETWPIRMLSTITFTAEGGGTAVTIHWEPYEAGDAERATFDAGRDSMRGGWTGTFEQLADYLAGD
jgi:uncharacterized protein YndB with AHSA1/START domain